MIKRVVIYVYCIKYAVYGGEVMTINSIGSYSPFSYGNTSVSASNMNSEDIEAKGNNRPEGGRGVGKKDGTGGRRRLRLDSDSDGNLSKTEMSDYATKAAEKLGVSIDVEDIFNEFDADEDGSISGDEIKDLLKSNELKLPSHDKMMNASQSRRNSVVMNQEIDIKENNLVIQNDNIIAKYMEAYATNNNYDNQNAESILEVML